MKSNQQSIVRTADEARSIAIVGDVYRFLVVGEETSGRYALWEATVPPGGGPPPHIHSREDEGFYVLEGELTIHVDGQRLVAGAGTFANLPAGSLHFFSNETQRPVKLLISVAPAGLEKMFLEVGQAVLPDGSAPRPSQADIENLLAAAPRYGIEIRLPKG